MPISLWDAGDSGGTGILKDGGGPFGHGGGGGRGGSLPTDPNAREFGTVLQLLSEGPIAGPINGLHSIKLDGTPILDVAGNPNFKGVAVALVAGTNTQVMIPGFTDAEAETSVNVKVSIGGGAVTRTISTAGISAIRVRIAVPTLKIINATSGAESGAMVQFKIERQAASYNSGAWETVVMNGEDIIMGKFGAKYTRSVRVETPTAGPWSIRVSRITPDHVSGAPDYTQDETWWDAYTEITDAKLRYPYSSLCALKVDAKQFQQIPKLTMEAKGRIISVPNGYTEASYNSTTGVWTAATYPGIWDGTFVQAWSENPAWIWYDLASHTRYGAGSVLDASKLDKWALYAISQACDVMVSDGKGGTEPRFRCSVYLQSQEDAIKLLQEMASIFRGMAYWAGGLVTAVQDDDGQPIDAIFTNSNVKDGKFTYQGSARKGRHTAALVTWMDPQNGYQASVEYVEDQTAITRYGYNPTQVAALGATSQAQARRWGMWTLLTETMDTEVVSFSAGLEGSTPRPGGIIATRDQFRAGDGRLGGRILAGATTTVVPLDGPCTLPAGTNTLTVRMQDGTVQTSTITTAAGTVSSITVSPAFTVAPVALSQWAVNVALYRVLGIKKGSDLYWDITALEHTPSKYALIDGVTVTPGPATPVNLLTPPTSLAMADVVRIEKDKLVQTLTASWSGDATALYAAEASQDYGEWQLMKVAATSASLDGITAGAWRVRVQTIYPAGASAWATGTHTVGTPTQTATDAAAAAAAAAAAQTAANNALALAPAVISSDHSTITLPSSSYPAGKVVFQTTDNTLWQVNAAGTGWQTPSMQTTALIGTIVAGQIAAGAIGANALAATIAMLGVITSTTYTPGNSSSGPVGYKLSGPAFTTTYIGGGTNASCHFELEGTANFGGYQVATVLNNIAGAAGTATWGGITGASPQAAPAGGWTGNHGAVSMGALTATTGTFSSTVSLPSVGRSQFVAGNGDDASLSMCNIDLLVWNGFGLWNPTTGGAFPNQRSIYFDVRNGAAGFGGAVSMGALTATGNVRSDVATSASSSQFNLSIAGVHQWSIYRPASSGDFRIFSNTNTIDVLTLTASGAATFSNSVSMGALTATSASIAAGGGIAIADGAPGTTTGRLYSVSAQNLQWSGSTILTMANVGSNAATLQAAVASATAPLVGTYAQMTAYVVGAGTPYWYATDVLAPDGLYGRLYKWSGSAWVDQGNPQTVVGRIVAGVISAGAIGAQALASDIIMTNVFRSTGYTAGTGSAAPSGFKMSGNTFTSYFLDGSTAAANMELGGIINLQGYRLDYMATRTMTKYNRILNGSFYWDKTGWTDNNGTFPFTWLSTGYDTGSGCIGMVTTGTTITQISRVSQPFNSPPTTNTVSLSLWAKVDAGMTTASVGAYLYNTTTGTVTTVISVNTVTYTSWTNLTADITSLVSGGGDFVLQIYANGHATTSGQTVYIDKISIIV